MSSSVASPRSSPLAGKTFFLRSVTPESPAGPFPARIQASFHIKFAAASYRVGFRNGAVTSASGSYELGEEARSIRFTGVSWSKRALLSLPEDDAEGTLARRHREAEGLQQKISRKGDWFGLSLLDEGHILVLKDNEDGAQYVFAAAEQGTTADGRQTH